MSFRVAWLTGSRFVRNGTVFSRQGQNTLKDNISGCRYEATAANAPFVVSTVQVVVVKIKFVVAKLQIIKYIHVYAVGTASAVNAAVAMAEKNKTVYNNQKEDSIFQITNTIVEQDVKLSIPQVTGIQTNQQPTTHGLLAEGKQPNQQSNPILAQAQGMQVNQKLTTNIPPVK